MLGAPVGLSVYFDGVRMNEPFGSVVNWDLIPMKAIASVEAVPGSNPMFGLNTLGGAVVVTTKNGADHPGLGLSLNAGSFKRKALSVEYGWQNAERRTDHYLSLNLDEQDGYRRHSGSSVKQFFGKTRWQSDKRLSGLELSVALADTGLSGTQSLPLSMLSDPKSAYTYPDKISNQQVLINLKGNHVIDDDHSVIGNVYFRKSNARSQNSNAHLDDGCYDAAGDLTAACQNISGGTGTAPNAVAANALGLARYTGDINTSMVYSATHQRTWGTGLQWSSLEKLGAYGNSLSLGFNADVSSIRYDQSTVLARLLDYEAVVTPNLRYYFPSTGGTTGSNVISSVALQSTTRNLSLFGTDTLEVNDRLSVTASGSYNVATIHQNGVNSQFLNEDGGYSWTDVDGTRYYNPSYVGAQYYRGTPAVLSTISSATVAAFTPGPQLSSLSGDHVYRRFNPAFGFNFNPDRSLGLFGGYSESMRAPTSVELSCADPQRPCALPTGFNGDPELKAVVAKTIELGARGKGAEGLSWNVAVYDTRTSNDIQFMFSSATTGYFNNVGDTERRGLELGLQKKTAAWLLAADLGWVRARYRTAFTTAQGVNVEPGNLIPGVAAHTLKLRAAYQFGPDLNLGANLVAASGQYAHGDEGNTDSNGKVPGYAVLNLDLRSRLNREWTLYGQINNVLDKVYSTYGTVGTNVYTGATEQFRTPAAPRSLWVGLIYRFGGKDAGAK